MTDGISVGDHGDPRLDPIFAVPARYPFGVRLRYRSAQDDTVDGAVVGQRGKDGVAMAASHSLHAAGASPRPTVGWE